MADPRSDAEARLALLMDTVEAVTGIHADPALMQAIYARRDALAAALTENGLLEELREALILAAVPLETLHAEITEAPSAYAVISPTLRKAIAAACGELRAVAKKATLRASAPPAITDANGLLPCPRGGEGKHHKVWVQDEPMMSGPNKYRVLCLAMPSCWSGPIMGTKADAIAAWNRRASAPRQEADKLLRRLLNAHGSESDFDGEQWDDALAAARAYLTVAAPPPEETR